MDLLARRFLIVLPIILVLTHPPPRCLAYSINDPIPGCVIQTPGGKYQAPYLRAPSALQQTCLNSYTRYNIPDPDIDADYDLLYSGFFLNHPYMSGNQPRDFLRALDHPDSAGKNEFHVNQKDTQLLFNYLHAADSTAYYGSPSFGGPKMLFFTSSPQDQADRDHIDIYLNHPSDNIIADFYPAHYENPDKKEDFPLTGPCLEYYNNAIQSGAIYRGKRVAPDFFTVVRDSDATWYQSGNFEQTRINHESQHLFFSSAGRSGSSFPNETLSMAAEFIGGGQLRDATRSVYNTVYDRPLNWGFGDAAKVNLGYSHWYLWMAYLYLKFPGDTTRIEDDLLYKYVRYKEGSIYNNQMYGLAQTLANSAYASLGGATGSQRLRNLLHNYSLAKWINNPSPSFYGGLYGFGHGVVPSRAGPMFDNSYNPCDKYTALEVPPTFLVGSDRVSTDSTITGHWCVTDYNQGLGCTAIPSRVTCDTLGVWLYGADYVQFRADPYFDNGKQNTLHFKMTWDPSTYPGTGHSGNSLRISAISYPIASDSLYVHGDLATSVAEAVMDSLHGFAEIWVPNFGTSAKSAVVSIDLGEVNPPSGGQSGGQNARQFFYGYSFGVDIASSLPTAAINLKAHRVGALGADSLKWTDPGSCGTSGYYIQRSFETQASPITFDSTSAGVFVRAYPTSGDTLRYYRVIAKGGSGCSSNFASLGGHVRQNHTVNGVLYLSGDLTVDYQKTLTLNPGTLVRIRPNSDSRQEGTDTGKTEVTVNGRLDAIGTAIDSIRWVSDASAPSAGDWKGLRMLNASDNASKLDYNAIRFAYHGLYLEECAPRIDHCRIQQNTFYGIYAFGDSSVSLITNCILEQNHGAELISAFGAAPTVKNCHLHYSASGGPGAVDDGAVFSGGGTGVFRMNRIVGVGMGVYCATLSNPSFIGQDGSNPFGRNDILEFRSYGVRTYDQSLPVIGLNDNPGQENQFQSGRNNIFSTGFPSAVFVQHTDPATHLKAQYCYWNGVSTADTTKFKGLVDDNRVLAGFDQVAGPGWYYPSYQAASGLRTPDEVFADALGKELAGDIEAAVAAYRSLLLESSASPLAVQALSRLLPIQMRRGKASDELAYAASLEATALNPELRRLAKRYRPSLLLAADQRDAALERYSVLLNDEQVDRPGVLLEIALLKGKVLGDVAGARAAISDLQQCTTDWSLLKHARGMLEEVVGQDIWVELTSPTPGEAASGAAAADPFTLEQSTPNPMNPRASIAFRIPRAGHATLRIYDVQGRMVRTLVDAELAPGRHVADWDGRSRVGNSVASGMYYYRLDFGGKHLVRRTIVLK